MSYRCPNCQSTFERRILYTGAGLCGNDWAYKYHCGTVCWPDSDEIDEAGIACNRIAALEAQIAAVKMCNQIKLPEPLTHALIMADETYMKTADVLAALQEPKP